MNKDFISLSQGSGGKEMQDLIASFKFNNRGEWKHYDDDGSIFDLGNGKLLVFTTDSFIVDPIFFPGGDIGHLAVCGTINDICVMGATPIGISLAIVIEEGFSRESLDKIIASVDAISSEIGVPIATGDTKVMQKGKVDGIIINTSGIGIMDKDSMLTKEILPGDKIILSGGLGEHAVALLSRRFDYSTSIITDSKPLIGEIASIRHIIKYAKDPTRGGIASILNEICDKKKIGMTLIESAIPAKEEVIKVVEMLGINLYELACEGRFICITESAAADEVVKILKTFNKDAAIIGEITSGNKVIMNTFLGKRIIPMPTGNIVPRIC